MFPSRAFLLLLLTISSIGLSCSRRPSVRVVVQQPAPALEAGAHEIVLVLENGGFGASVSMGIDANAGLADSIVLNVADPRAGMKGESFEVASIRANGFTIVRVTGADAKAALWGGLEAADRAVANADIRAVGAIHGAAFLPVRAAQAQLPAGSAGPIDRKAWSDFFDSLVRDRFNTIFFKLSARLDRIADDQADSPSSIDRRQNVSLAHSLFQLARERGLSPILAIEKSAVAGLINSAPPALALAQAAPSAPQTAVPDAAADLPRNALPQLLPSVMKTYPELGGVAVSDETIFTYAPPERRAGWVAESIVSPLAAQKGAKQIFIGTTGEWWPNRSEFGVIPLEAAVILLAPIRRFDDLPASGDVPVLWATESASDLLPWQDANAVRDTIQKIARKASAGLLEDARERGKDEADPPATGSYWFRSFLLGRMGHSPDLPTEALSYRFSQGLGGAGGAYVFSAAAEAGELNKLLAKAGSLPFLAIPDLSVGETALFRPPLAGESDALMEALSAEGLTPASGRTTEGDSTAAASTTLDEVAKLANVVLNSVAEAEKKSAWKSGEGDKMRGKIESIARTGLAYSALAAARRTLIRFSVTGNELFRRQAIDTLTEARKGLDAVRSGAAAGSSPDISAQVAGLLSFAKRAHTLQWDKIKWDIGVKSAWQPASATDVPIPSEWKSAQTSQLPEFGAYGRAPWLASVNSKLSTAFIPISSLANPAAGAYFVAKTTVTANRAARLVVRLTSDSPATIWIDKLQPARLPPFDFPWTGGVPSVNQPQMSLFTVSVQPGNLEIVIGAFAKQDWPKIAMSYLLAPDASEVLNVNALAPASKDGLVRDEVSDGNPQANIHLDPAQKTGAGRATYSFKIRNAGLYRVRLYAQWPGGGHPFGAVSIDGAPANFSANSAPGYAPGWRWALLDGVIDLGAGEHTLVVGGWKTGELLASIEVRPAW